MQRTLSTALSEKVGRRATVRGWVHRRRRLSVVASVRGFRRVLDDQAFIEIHTPKLVTARLSPGQRLRRRLLRSTGVSGSAASVLLSRLWSESSNVSMRPGNTLFPRNLHRLAP